MRNVKRVLVPTDFSEASEHALPHAVELARLYDAEIVVLHVRTLWEDDPNREEYQFFDNGRYSAFVEEQLEKTGAKVKHHRVQTAVRRNVAPAAGILDYVEDEPVDVVVMGTHGRSGIKRFFLGSVAERILRHSSVPVLTVAPAGEGYRDAPVYRKILATYDFSEHSNNSAIQAHELAQRYGAKLEVLYVVEQEVHPGYLDEWRISVQGEMPHILEKARTSFADLLGGSGLSAVTFRVEVGRGDGRVHRDITEFAVQTEADLIVMGTYGLSGVEHMLLGSTTERVVRIAPCPVMTFHLA